MSKGSGITRQRWRTRQFFPEDEIREGWSDGYSVTSLTFGNGMWALVMSKGKNFYQQSWFTDSKFPKDKISEKWDDGKYIMGIGFKPENGY